MVKIPNFDDVDLGIICILIILIVISIALILTNAVKEGLGVVGGGITAIATLAGRRIKNNGGDNNDSTTNE